MTTTQEALNKAREALKPFADAYDNWRGDNAPAHFKKAVCHADFKLAAESFDVLRKAIAQPSQEQPSAPVAQAGSAESEREAEIVGDTRFEGWLSESIARTDSYIKQDMREAYWAGYQERAALSAQGQQSEDARDAKRYRWLRDKASSAEVEAFWWMDSVDEMEAAIDYAMSTPSEKG